MSFTYDAASRRATMTVAGQSAVSYTDGTADRLTQIAQGGRTVGLTFDTANRRTSVTLPNGVVLTYACDTASRRRRRSIRSRGGGRPWANPWTRPWRRNQMPRFRINGRWL